MEFISIVLLVVAVWWWFFRDAPTAEAENQESSKDIRPFDSEPRVTILSTQSGPSSFGKAASEFDLAFTPKPTKETAEIRSSEYGSETKYLVHLLDQTCTCADFSRRSHRQKDHFSRWCKHLIKAFAREGAFESADDWQKAIAEDAFGGPNIAYMLRRGEAPPVLITAGGSDEWINVYARKKRRGEKVSEASGPIERHGWNLAQQRWSYGEGPDGAREIKKVLKEIDRLT